MADTGATCVFTFTPAFATLNGIYRIRAETTFADAFASGVDFIAHLYTPAGLQVSDFNTAYASYAKDRVYVLESQQDTTVVYYVPESIFLKLPDPTVKEYLPLNLMIRLGVFANPQEIYPLLDQVKDLIQASLGVTDPLRVISNPQNKAYLTDAEYTALQTARQANIEALVPFSVQIKQLENQKIALAAKCAAYESLIAELSSPPPP